MIRKTINFSKGFLPAAIVSIAVIALGVVGFFTVGINFGGDFAPGLIESVKIDADNISVEDVRVSLSGISGVDVKKTGEDGKSFQLSVPVVGSDGQSADENEAKSETVVVQALKDKYGADKVTVVSTNYISKSFSDSLAKKSVLLLLVTVVLIWIYATIRFHWDFALGSIVALLHDAAFMFTFIIWAGKFMNLSFNTTVLAAVLTIIGYSINDTVVILDRVRQNIKLGKFTKFNDILDKSLSESLGRSIITTLTTLVAILPLSIIFSIYIGTNPSASTSVVSIKDFSIALMVGLLSGCYSSLFISSGFISLCRKNWKPEYGIHHSNKGDKGVLQMDSGVVV